MKQRCQQGIQWQKTWILVLAGAVEIILLFYFPKSTTVALAIGGAAVCCWFLSVFFWTRSTVKSNEVAAEELDRLLNEAGTELGADLVRSRNTPPKRSVSSTKFRFHLYLLTVITGLLCSVLHSILKKDHQLTPHVNSILLAVCCLVGGIFAVCNLRWGVREKVTWVSGFSNISRSDSPCNYWVAIGGWVFLTVGCMFGLIDSVLRYTQ
jgi:hypothetical protein